MESLQFVFMIILLLICGYFVFLYKYCCKIIEGNEDDTCRYENQQRPENHQTNVNINHENQHVPQNLPGYELVSHNITRTVYVFVPMTNNGNIPDISTLPFPPNSETYVLRNSSAPNSPISTSSMPNPTVQSTIRQSTPQISIPNPAILQPSTPVSDSPPPSFDEVMKNFPKKSGS